MNPPKCLKSPPFLEVSNPEKRNVHDDQEESSQLNLSIILKIAHDQPNKHAHGLRYENSTLWGSKKGPG